MNKKLIYVALLGLAFSQLQGCSAIDRRTTSAYVGDQEIELRTMQALSDNFPQKNKYIAATSFNRQVLLTGQVPDEAMKAKVTEVVKAVPEVRTVFNELAVSGVVSLTSYTSDSTLTSKVKTRLWEDERAPGTKIKVKTESGTVYLMGLLTRAEAAAAAEVARTTAGVTKVVTLFEYID